MRRVSERQESGPPLSTSSLYLKPHHLPDRDSGYTEPDSDLDSSSHYHLQPSSARGVYPFSDDEDSTMKHHHHHHQQPTWSSSTINKPFPPSSTSSLSFPDNTPSSLVDASSYHTFQADQAIDAVRQHAHEKDWKKVLKHKSGVVVYMVQKQVNGEKMAVFKGESVIHGFTPQSVFYVIGMRKLWDDQFEDGNLVQNLNETTSITYEAYRASGSSRAYDMTLVEKIDCSNDGVIVFACTSVTTSQVAKTPGRTRNEVKLHGWILRLLPTTPPSTHVTFITEEFIRGWIPGLTKKSLARKPLVIASIDSYLKRKAQTFATTNAQQEQQQQPPPAKPTNKLLSPLSAYTQRRPSIMEQQSSPSLLSPMINKASILTNPPPRRSSLNPRQPTSRSSSLNKRITFADDVLVPSSPIIESPVNDQSPLPSQQLPASSYLQAPQFDSPSSNEKLYPSARHRSIRKESLANYKRLYSSDIEEWKELGDREGVRMYSKASPGSTLPILRGDCIIEGTWTPEQVCSVVQSFGARAKWDDSFESGRIVERFSQKEYLVYLQMRSVFPINSRDYSLLTQIDSDARSETIHVVSTSVTDHLVPENDAHTRGRMLIYGWTFQAVRKGADDNDDDEQKKQQRTGVKVTFIAHMDPAGATPLPSAIVRLLTSEVPLCVLRVRDYITNAGCPPYIRRVAGKVMKEHYDPETHHYTLSYIAKHLPSRHHHNEQTWCTDIRLHRSVYKDSFTATTKQDDVSVVTQPAGVRVYTKSSSLDGMLVEIDITPASATERSSPRLTPLELLEGEGCTTAAGSVHPLMQGNDQIPDVDACVNNNKNHVAFDLPHVQNRQRSNSMVVIGDHLSFNGPQLSVILFLMALSYYVGKFSCRC